MQFPISSDDCSLLIELEACENLGQLAARLGRDASVVSRRLKNLMERHPVIEKHGPHWKLTELGLKTVLWSKEALRGQAAMLDEPQQITIVTNQEFASRVLSPELGTLREKLGVERIRIISKYKGAEEALLSGEAEVGIDCYRPNHPDVRFNATTPERLAVLASPKFLKRHKLNEAADLAVQPYLSYERIRIQNYIRLDRPIVRVPFEFNDIASTRSACIEGLGWCLLPLYCVRNEIDQGLLKICDFGSLKSEMYGVWWLHSRQSLKPYVHELSQWMRRQKLD